MKKIIFFSALFVALIANGQNPGTDDGRRPVEPIQHEPTGTLPSTKKGKPYTPVGEKAKKQPPPPAPVEPSACDVIGTGTRKFKSIALNTRNGGVWLIGEDDRLYGCGFHYYWQGAVSVVGNSRVENITSDAGRVLVSSMDGYGMLGGGFPPPHVRKITEAFADFPDPNTKYAYSDPEAGYDRLWYLNEGGFIKSANSSILAENVPPPKVAKMFTAYNRRFFMIDEANDLYIWKSASIYGTGFGGDWIRFGTIKAKFITTEAGISTPLWYIGMDDKVYMLADDNPETTTPIDMNAKAKSITAFGSQLYYIGLDGYFYLRVATRDLRVAL